MLHLQAGNHERPNRDENNLVSPTFRWFSTELLEIFFQRQDSEEANEQLSFPVTLIAREVQWLKTVFSHRVILQFFLRMRTDCKKLEYQ